MSTAVIVVLAIVVLAIVADVSLPPHPRGAPPKRKDP